MSYIYPRIGAFRRSDQTCVFSVWAPLRRVVRLVIETDGHRSMHEMTCDERGVWTATVDGVTATTRYAFQLDDDQVLPDPASRFQPDGVHDFSAVPGPWNEWTDQQWKGLPLKDMVIYELHVGTFSQSGTFAGVVEKLDYLAELGVNAIEIMPVSQFPGSRNWGYDGVYPFAVQNSYGGPDELKRLVNAAHERGIAVILDVVYNHQGPEGNYFESFGPYFTDKYRTFWGKAINFDDAYCDGVRNIYWQNAMMWLDEFHIDGLRLDAVHAIWDFSANHFIGELVKMVKGLQTETGVEKVLIGEFDLNNPRYIISQDEGGLGLDGQWIDEFHHALHAVVTGEVNGYYEDFGEISHLAKALQRSYVYTGEYSIHRKKHFGASPEKTNFGQFVVFAQNHDQIGNRLAGDRLTNHLTFEGLKVTAAAYLLAPQVPMIFMGEEYGEKRPFQYFISHTDEKLVDMVREGRKREFAYFNWDKPVPDPQGEDTFRKCILGWDYQKDKYQQRLLDYYTTLIHFRKKRIAYQGKQPETMKVHEPGKGSVIAFDRAFSTDRILVVMNFGKSSSPFVLPSSATPPSKKIFDSSAMEWLGPGEITFSTFNSHHEILLHPESVVIFEY